MIIARCVLFIAKRCFMEKTKRFVDNDLTSILKLRTGCTFIHV